MSDEFLFEIGDLFGLDAVQMATDTAVDDADLDCNIHWLVLVLLQQLSESLASREELLGRGVHVRTELGEGGNFTILGQVELHRSRNLLHRLHLGGGTDTGDGKTDVDSRTDTLVRKTLSSVRGPENNLCI